jgi:predicted ATPase
MADAEPTDDTDQEQLELFEDPTGDGLADALVEPPPASDEAAPRIRLVRFSNFKSFDHFEVSLGNFNVVAGANNAGKSTLLQGIDLLYTLLKLHQERGQLAKARLVSPALLPVATGRDMFFRQVWRRSNVYVEASIGAEFADGSTIDFGLRYMFGNINSRVLENRGLEGTRLQALLARAAVWVPSAVGIVRDEEYRPPARQRGLVAAGRHNEVLRNTLVELRQNSEQRYGLLQSILRERFSAAVGEATFDPDLDQFVHGTYNADDGVEHDLYSAGSGFIQVLQMLAFVLARDAGVVLLDEPDAHLHSSLQRVVVEILDEISRDAGFQVLIATHSKEIINFVDPSRLILIEAGQGTAGLVSTDVTPVTVLKTLGAIDNVDAFALVRNRKGGVRRPLQRGQRRPRLGSVLRARLEVARLVRRLPSRGGLW